tara:strand:+ start:1741 stop:2142 length:402 start_codon:yes stop_codon:yes gene_type:complete
MPKNKYTEKQMKIARVAEPRDSITGADFEALNNSKMGGGMVKYAEGGDVRKEMLIQMLEDARENNDDDKIIEIEAELFQMGDGQGMMGGGMVKRPGYRNGGRVKGYRDGMSVSSSKGKGCGIATSGRGYSGTY